MDDAFSALVREHVLIARARSRMLEDVRAGKPWAADLVEATVSIGDTAHGAQLVGTFSLSSSTFLWGWANPGARDWGRSLALVTSLRGRGGVFAEAKLHANDVNPNELAGVVGELSGGLPVFVGTYDGGAAFFVLTDLALPLERFSLAYLPGVVLDTAVVTTQPVRPCVESLLRALGFALEPSGAGELLARRGPAVFRLAFDAEGRPGTLELKHGP